VLGLLTAVPQLLARDLLPLETFFGADSIQQMSLSPDGDKIAMIAPNNGRYGIALLDTKTGKLSMLIAYEKENVSSLEWKGNDRILFSAFSQGHEVPMIATTDLEAKSIRRILEPQVRRDENSILSGSLLDLMPWEPNRVLIIGYTAESDERRFAGPQDFNPTPTVYTADVRTGRRSEVLVPERNVDAGRFDRNLQQRITIEADGDRLLYQVRSRNDSPWQRIRSFDVRDHGWSLLGLRADGRQAYIVDTTENDLGDLRVLDVDSGKFVETLFSPQESTVIGLIFSRDRERLLGVRHEGVKRATHWIDPKWQKIGATLERNFPDHIVSVVSISQDEKRFIFRISSDRDPGRFFLGDLRGDALQVQLLSAVRPAIQPERMSPMVPISFAARDGLVLHGYLTKPQGKADRTTPLLVMPHGGPFGIRDSWGFSGDVQFLADRGYSVLQLNYRGSGGYGAKFERAGYREWGGKMQDDLTDSVKWAISQGLCDPARVGIIGASYGGYAALAGVTFTPELYRVGINYVGVSDLRLITRWDTGRSATSRAVYEQRIGRDMAVLEQRSPVNFVQNIRVPTLHAYGLNDPRVEISHWDRLEAELKKHGKVYEGYVEREEGHGFGKAENAIRFYGAVEKFLARYMTDQPDVPTGETKIGPLRVVEMPATQK
jgi:dipeptidyl aminopeptidase/acylaminoacyl peptidase